MATKHYPGKTVQQLLHHNWHHMLSSWLTFWIFFICMLTPVLPEVIYRVDPLALLAATLRTYQRAGCDSEQLSLSCPRGTSISIELAQYGRAGDLTDHSLCPPISRGDMTTTGSSNGNSGVISSSNADGSSVSILSSSTGTDVIYSSTQIEVKPPELCTVSGLQYTLLQTVVEACQKKRHCKFSANSKPLANGDPCAGIRKFVEIAYKCRPYEFRSKVACESDNMPLVCNPYSRIAIYSASFGFIERESVQCPHNNTQNAPDTNTKQTCLVSYATETVMQICHGRRRCSITADAGTFGRPCKNDIPMHLKVVYTCIPRKVLKDRYETAPEPDEPQQSDLDLDQDELYDEDQFYKEGEAIPPAPKLQGAIPNAGFPYDFNMRSNEPTTTLVPSILSRNDNSLEDDHNDGDFEFNNNDKFTVNEGDDDDAIDVGSSIDTPNFNKNNLIHKLSKFFLNNQLESETTTNISSSTAATSSENSQIINDEDDGVDGSNELPTSRYYIYRKRCQMEDDWGVIGLNCTNDDIIKERVVVIGFLVNWIKAFIHIKKNQEQFYLYLIISVAVGMLLCLTLVIGRLTLQRSPSCRKNSLSSCSNHEKNTSDKMGSTGIVGGAVADDNSKFQHELTAREAQLSGSFADDISDIDTDIDLTSPMQAPSFTTRNETYMTYAPIPNCTYDSLGDHSSSNYGTATTIRMPSTSQHNNLMMPAGHNINNRSGCSTVGKSRQTTPPPQGSLYNSIGVCSPSVSGAMTMGPHILTPSILSTTSSQNMGPSYLSGTIMVPGHHHSHTGTLRRQLVPTSIGMMNTPQTSLAGVNAGLHSMVGVPTSSSVYYDSTIPRHLNRGMSADNTQYFYG